MTSKIMQHKKRSAMLFMTGKIILKLRILGLSIVILIFTFLIFNSANAAPQFLVSWKADSYVPSWYQGKVLPSRGTPITVSFEIVDGGRTANLSGTAVRWYINDKLVRNETSGLGIQSISFAIPDYGGQETEVRIAIPNYRGSELNQIVRIPVKNPEVVIDGKFMKTPIKTGDNAFHAIPFFFNVESLADLGFDWTANGQDAKVDTATPWNLNLNVDENAGEGFFINLQVVVRNFLDQLEFGSREIQLEVRK